STTPSAAWSPLPSATCRRPARNSPWAASGSGWRGRMRGGRPRCMCRCMGNRRRAPLIRPFGAPSPRGRGEGLVGWVLALVLLLFAGIASAAPRIGVMTMQPGEIFWERFGHDAIVVQDPETGRALSYNFGFFDPTEPGFLGRFIRGEMEYMLVALPLEQDLAIYREEGRGVSIQWLDLSAARATSLAGSRAVAAQPENARYRYDYFTENCSTKVRDALDAALGGQLHHQIAGRSRGNTYRSEAVRLASPAPWMWLGFDIGLSRHADQ